MRHLPRKSLATPQILLLRNQALSMDVAGLLRDEGSVRERYLNTLMKTYFPWAPRSSLVTYPV